VNVSLFRSWWSVVAVIVSGGFVWWLAAAGSAAGAREGSDVDIVLASGWTTLGIMVAVCVYSLRKFMHRLGISPEFKLKVPLEQLEQAEQGLNDIRRRVLLGLLNNAAEIREMAQRELAAHGADRICKAKVTPGAVGGPAFIVGVEPTEPLGRMSRWLHFHVYLGLASGVTLWVHGGFSMVSPMGVILNGLAVLVIVTGVVGTVLFALGPRWMTRAERDMNHEQAFVLERSLKAKIREAYDGLDAHEVKRLKGAGKATTRALVHRTALMSMMEEAPEGRQDLQDVMVLVSQRRRILDDLAAAARVKFSINVWRVVHVPCSLLLLGFAIVHTVSVIWY